MALSAVLDWLFAAALKNLSEAQSGLDNEPQTAYGAKDQINRNQP